MTEGEDRLVLRLGCRADTDAVGFEIGRLLVSGDVLALIGDLGAGKTTLTQSLARGMGVVDEVTSPTFALIHEYGGKLPLYHFDPYRLHNAEDLVDLGLEEYFERRGVVVSEWADRIESLLPDDRLRLHLRIVDDGAIAGASAAATDDAVRSLEITAAGPRSRAILAKLRIHDAISVLREGVA